MISLACTTFDDAPALERLLQCCVALPHVAEFVVLDHRSRDSTKDLVEAWVPRYARCGVPLRYEYEGRDLSRRFTLADLLERLFAACRNDIVCRLDADFVIGDGFIPVLESARDLLAGSQGPFAVSFEVPLLDEGVRFDERGVLAAHGRWRPHPARPWIVHRDRIGFTLRSNRFPEVTGREAGTIAPPRPIDLPPDGLVSVDIRSPERRRLRDTMTKYQRWAIETGSDLSWLEAYESGALEGLSYGWTPPTFLDDDRFVGQRFRLGAPDDRAAHR